MQTAYRFEIQGWDESTYLELQGGGKFTRASIKKHYTGNMQGQGVLDYLMSYQADGSAFFVGIERITASLEDRQGAFTISHRGTFAQGKVVSSFDVVEGSGVDGFVGFSGQGQYQIETGREVDFSFTHN